MNISLNRRTAAKKIRGCKKRRQPPVTFRLHRGAHAQLTIFREKIRRPNSARQPVKTAARVHRDRESGGHRDRERVKERTKERRAKKKLEKVREAYRAFYRCIVFQRVSSPPPRLAFVSF